ncbi:MAG TPA: CoA-binding protein [Methanothrix sp.]|nr:CoA-binding protein [Methanothrix sp.]HOK57916.1 CoA-binding protein [Methanothrix sp.]HOL43319.1 CoA-binding protein [Methanothrix sp.]HPO88230.1 CoA-binding protein [Methanothrix sp.]
MPILRGDEELKKVLKGSRTVAVLGASTDPRKPSFFVSLVVRTYGFRMFFVNPNHEGEEILGERVYASLREIPVDIDIVDVFRRPSAAREVAEEIRAKGCRTVWFQPGTEDMTVARELADEGFNVVVGCCLKIECRKLL